MYIKISCKMEDFVVTWKLWPDCHVSNYYPHACLPFLIKHFALTIWKTYILPIPCRSSRHMILKEPELLEIKIRR